MEDKERAERVAGEEEEIDGEWWSWGAGTDGQLGTGRLQDEHLPQLLSHLSSSVSHHIVSQLACGGAHVIALSSGGRVLTWGRGTCGQLGHGELANGLLPKPVKFFESFVISNVSAGWNHSGFVSDSGEIFTCGDGSFGQLGHGDYQSHCSPVKVLFFCSKHVEQVACGMRHSLVLLKGDSEHPVYGFGSGKRGQLGFSEDRIRSCSLPQATFGFEDVKIINISANGDHSAALSADGQLYTWGKGFGGTSDAYFPQILASPFKVLQVALGWNHALLLTGEYEVFMLGGKLHGMLGDPQKMSQEKHSTIHSSRCIASNGFGEANPEKVSDLDGVKVISVSAGAEHSALVTENGVIMTWGWGEHGQLGLGNTLDETSPQIVNLDGRPNGNSTFHVYCGSGFTFAIRTVHIPSQI
ncbi:ultraviolet-B receptor UVR8 isoform X2 [Macadamia integrifolia]|uniref:ultraviolet-B receptor UVR8 isoform X2 n=1 Tax=Macadamia integrifolia TaxID=60698 RepID=UPI001C4FC119|nr:ultraviolet-B receptor UVR8 isoform X2 [Macadamia integrifolia]